ncbi:MAG: peptidoglycan DD-metalloendopeptidase family protein, partial [Flavobacteriales bacterium]|nr:peptidoglycan DD-metalloendopeptidase family protein [Flavobacteriales bacterium]
MKKLLFSIFIFFLIWNISAQEREQLENDRNLIQKEIKKAERLLKQTNEAKEVSLEQLYLIEEKITDREELIKNYDRQIKVMTRQIDENKEIIGSLEKDINSYKNEYVEILREAAKRDGSYDKLMFVLSSESFNQAYKRMKYLQQYSSYRKNQVDLIKKTQETLNNKVQELEEQRSEKIALVDDQEQERLNLGQEKKERQDKISNLKSKEKILAQEIRKKKRSEEKLAKAIKEAIAKATKPKSEGLALTPRAKEIMGKFENNKGKIRWPVEQGVITGFFGRHRNQELQIDVENNGIDLATEPTNKAKAVFDGVISQVIIIPNAGKAIMLKHGDYWTVYFKIKEALVEPGQEVKMGDDLGTIITDAQKGTTV